jgi:hypothetical protein
MTDQPPWQAKLEWTLVFLGVIFYLFVFPHSIGGDGSVRYEALIKLLAEGKISPMLYSYVGPLVSAPLYYLGYLAKGSFWWVSRFNSIVFLASAYGLWRFFRREWSPAQARLFLLLLFCGSMFPKHVTDYYSEVFSACAMALAIGCFLSNRFPFGAVLLCLSVWNGPGTLVAGAFVLAHFARRERRWRYVLLLLPLLLGIFLENFLKFGTVFPEAYMAAEGTKGFLPYTKGPGFSYPLFFGLLSVLLSFGKGLLFYTPGLLCVFCPRVFRDGRAGIFLQAGLAYIVGLLLVYSRWWAWSGDAFWGPRFYLFVSLWAPVALAALWPSIHGSAARLYFWVAATALSIYVGWQGIMYGRDFLEDCFRSDIDLGFMCHYVPEYSALWRVFIVWPVPHGRKVAYLAYFLLVFAAVLRRPGREAVKTAFAWLGREASRLFRLREWKM